MATAETQADLLAVRRRIAGRLPRRHWRRQLVRIAAAVAAVLVLGWLGWYYTVGQRSYRLYLAAFDRQPVQAYQALRSLQPRADTLDPRIVRGLQALRAEDDLAALAAFRAYLATDPTPTDGRPLLYTGMLALATGYLAEARDNLQQLRRDYPAFYEDATWYLALSYLREHNSDRAIPLLEELIAPTAPGEYRRAATELLRQI